MKQHISNIIFMTNDKKNSRKRLLYGQNFLIKPNIIWRFIKKAQFTSQDHVVEIGAGKGAITKLLIKTPATITAIEKDSTLFSKLSKQFEKSPKLRLLEKDFAQFQLSPDNYHIFSNPPFNQTAFIIKKLYFSKYKPPLTSHLIFQKEAAYKFHGKQNPTYESIISLKLKPWYKLKIEHFFSSTDFYPSPNACVVLLSIKKLPTALLDKKETANYFKFIDVLMQSWQPTLLKSCKKNISDSKYNKIRKNNALNKPPSQVSFSIWLDLYKKLNKL